MISRSIIGVFWKRVLRCVSASRYSYRTCITQLPFKQPQKHHDLERTYEFLKSDIISVLNGLLSIDCRIHLSN